MNKLSEQESVNLSICHGDDLPSSVLTNSLPQILDRAAAKTTGIISINDRTEDFIAYRDLMQNARRICRGLRLQGLKPQDRVILYLQNPQYFFASLWGCFLGGFVPIPLGVELIFNSTKLQQAKELGDSSVVICDRNIEDLEIVRVEDLLNCEPASNWHFSQLDDLALLLFTSGSTGKPKGVMLSSRNLLASVYGMAKVNNLSQQDITLNWMPVEHVASLVMFHLTEVYLGCEQIQVKSEIILQNPLTWLDLIAQYRVSATWSPNFAYSLVNKKLAQGTKYNWNLSCLRWMGNGAEAVVGQTTQRFLELLAPYGLESDVVSPGYGMSETTSGIAHSNEFYCNSDREFVEVGAPIPGVSLRIVDEEDNIIPEGETGLLQVKGETVTPGYYQQSELNQEIFTPDGWFNTGDLGFLTAGRLTITGRQKDTIIINGVNYYNHDIEVVVESIASITISYTAACGVKDSNQQEQIAIFFNTSEQGDTLRELINQIRKEVFDRIGIVPAYIIPVTKQTIPKTAIGKIQRSKLVQRFAAGEFDSAIAEVTELFNQRNLSQLELPGNAIERKLVAVWQEVLNLTTVSVKDNFFELGGNSLLLMQVLSKLTPEYNLSAVDLFQYPTISSLASYLNCDRDSIAIQQGKRRGELRRQATGNKDVAIIGMSCRFPGANNIEEFWHNLCQGVESISFFDDVEILNSGVEPELLNNPDYVKATPILDNIEDFDAEFWGYSPKEARLLDPQQRLFMECAWEGLEDAGYDPFTYTGDISLYGGTGTNTYLLNNIYPHRHQIDEQDNLQVVNLSSMGGFQVSTANDKDYLTTRTSYKLNLTGSSVNVQTACSTSLVTVHLACQSLINSECDIALAGGVSIHSPQKMGYLYQEGMILSADGHCRAFDADASGTIFGSGAGMVVLKLLDKAIEDGDRIYGVIKGSAVNNDGGTKVGYFAPNVDGQTRVVSEALAYADIPPQSIGYIEAHGTGTKLGDPIEMKALSQAYGRGEQPFALTAVGSVKTNLGHLQMASGIVGLIKAVLCLKNQKIVPSLHFNNPNPQIDLDRSPFYINTQLQDWKTDKYPRRAGVNSLGIGGTNAHVILEEFVVEEENSNKELPAYLLTLSAKNEAALQQAIDNYFNYLGTHRETSLQDICFTSNIGRHHFDYRLGVVASNKQELVEELKNITTGDRATQNHKIAWLFTGQGSQYIGMAQQLYNVQPVFKEHCDRCFQILNNNVGTYHDTSVYHGTSIRDLDVDINQTQYAQPLLFTIEYSLAQLWLSWGIKPDVMLGHSIGEYVAATVAGVFSLADALKLVVARSKLMQSLPENGAMLAVFGEEIWDFLSQRREDAKEDAETNVKSSISHLFKSSICVSGNNASHIVLSGLQKDISDLDRELELLGIKTKLLNVSHAFHSPLMQPIVKEFKAIAETINYSLPKIPIVSNLTGELANETVATADYWANHILQPVQFARSIKYLDRQQVNIFLEIGTKPTLTAMAKSMVDNKLFFHSLDRNRNDWQNILATLSQLYVAGVNINWQAVTQNYNAQKISLPTYPFQRQRYWFDLTKEKAVIKSIDKNTISHPLLGNALSSPLKQTIFQSYLNSETHDWFKDHRIEDKIIFPGAAYLEIAIALGLCHYQNKQLIIEDLNIDSPLYLDLEVECDREIQIISSPDGESNNWEVYSLSNNEWQLHCSGKVSRLNTPTEAESLANVKNGFTDAELNVQQHYLACQQKGINYGKSFQGIKQLWAKDKQALGLIELPRHLNSQQYHFHPALLDACLQILFAALPSQLQTNTYIPIGLDKLCTYFLCSTRFWSYLKLKSASNDTILTADVWLYNESGELIAKLEGLKSQAIKSQPTWHNWLYQQEWIHKPLLNDSSLLNTGTWLIFADSTGIGNKLAALLKSQQQQYHLVTHDSIKDNPEAYQNLIQQHEHIAGVIYLWSLDKVENWQECKNYLYLVQALIQHRDNPSLWFITRNAQAVNNYQAKLDIRNSCLWGMQKAIALEHPELLCVGIDLDSPCDRVDNIFQEICTAENEQAAYRDGKRYAARLVSQRNTVGANGNSPSHKQEKNIQLHINNPGDLDSLEWKTTTRQQPQDNEIEIEVKATGLNFRDVMVALDLYPDKTKFLGLECAGVVTRIGKEVTNFQPGDEVIAISDNSFAQYLTVNSLLAISKPPSLSFTAAATIPVTFLTAYYTLVHLAQLQPGSKILIHAAAGGVGLAAIQIAQNIGAQIYATASTPKWELLKSMGVTNIMNSRSLDFADEIMSMTDGKGVDVILNSLSGEFIPKSISVLNKQGSFVEIGKQGIWSSEDVAQIKPTINYSIVDLWQITQDKPAFIQQMLSELHKPSQFTLLTLKPLPHKIFTRDRTIDAFRYMQQGKHQGKIIISMGDRVSQIAPTYKGTYLITGGMGAIGLQVARWLITKGVKNIVLVGRRDIKPEYKDSLKKLLEYAQVTCIKADISDTNQLSQALLQIKATLPPLKGVIHCAGVTRDRTIAQQDWQSFAEVLAGKAQGAWNLHYLTQKYDLENFILFSSASSLIGSAGQANYCAANAFLDTLAHARRSSGLPATSINWTAWQNTGLASNTQITAGLKQKGIDSIKSSEGIKILEQLLIQPPAQTGVIPIDWNIWNKNNLLTPFYNNFTTNNEQVTANFKQQLSQVEPSQRSSLLRKQISQTVRNILGIKNTNKIDLELGFTELGLDSLASVELRNKLQSNYNLKLSATLTFDYSNIKSLTDYIFALLFSNNITDESKNTTVDKDVLQIENLTEAEAEALLLAELENI